MSPACSGGPRDHAAASNVMLLVPTAAAKMRPQLERSVAVENDKDLLLRAVAVRWVDELSRADVEEPDPCLQGACGAAEVTDRPCDGGSFAPDLLHVCDVDDPRRSLRQLADLGRARRRLTRPRMVVPGALEHPGRAEPGDSRPWEQRVRGVVTLPERERVEAAWAGLERMCMLEREVNEAVALADG